MVSSFRERNAIDYTNAVTLKEIGLTDRPQFFHFGLRDYRPYAVQALLKADVLRITPENKVYLSETKAAEVEEKANISCPS